MILKIRNSKLTKLTSLTLIVVFISTLNPMGAYALTGGPAQPEFNSFTPIGTSDMVDLASGDFSYNIPLMDVGGFPINLAYSSGVDMDQEASWVGLGWDLSIGQINRQMRGLPDDFEGDKVIYENNMKNNWTVGANFKFSPELFDYNKDGKKATKEEIEDWKENNKYLEKTLGISVQYNSYSGYSISPSFGITKKMASGNTVGFDMESTPDGLVLSPSASLANKKKNADGKDVKLGVSAGLSFNSRQGLTAMNLSASRMVPSKIDKDNNFQKIAGFSGGSSISFVPNTYTPSIQTKMTSLNGTLNFDLGPSVFGLEGESEGRLFFTSQFIANKEVARSVYGYEHTEKAPVEAVLDFNREKDGVFTVNSTNLPLTNYTYDIYSVSGQGVAGMFHPYRSQVGYVFDNETVSNNGGGSLGVELEGGQLFGVGADIEANFAKNRSGVWKKRNDVLDNESFEETGSENPNYEEVYFKNVGDLSADFDASIYGYEDEEPTRLGGYDPIRFKFGGLPYQRELMNNYMRKGETTLGATFFDDPATFDNADGWNIGDGESIKRNQRVKRNQNIIKITKEEADGVEGIEANPHAKPHHTAGFIITRNDGARYYYGKALYNTTKKEVTFAIGDEIGKAGGGDGTQGNAYTGLVDYMPDVDNSLENTRGDHYFNRVTTPEYAHTYLLTSLLSTDYSDVDGIPGPSAGDFGSYTLFEYQQNMDGVGAEDHYNWRVPYQANKANFNEGLKTDPTDDKASYVYGEKEIAYIRKIETKTHVAIFDISERRDGNGVDGENGSPANASTNSKMYKLDKITLYSRGEYYDADGLTINPDAIPIKTAHFEYDYTLCQGISNNDLLPYDGDADGVADDNQGGKLTLRKVYFTYRNSNMGKYSPYEFVYGDKDHDGTEDAIRNPDYNLKGYDIWGGYKENPNPGDGTGDYLNPLSDITAPEFNYVEQSVNHDKATTDDYAAAWSMTDIVLPSGGEIKIDYESDDYQYVQNKKAMRMFKLVGAGNTLNPLDSENDFGFTKWEDTDGDGKNDNIQISEEALLYKGTKDAEYLYFLLDEEDYDLDEDELTDQNIFRKKYLGDIFKNQECLLQFRMALNMSRKGGKKSGTAWKNEPFDYVSGYAELNNDIAKHEFFTILGDDAVARNYGSIRLKKVKMEGGWFGTGLANVNPVAKAGWQYGRRYLAQYVYGLPGLDQPDDGGGEAAFDAVIEGLYQIYENFQQQLVGPNATLKSKNIARRFLKEKSWIRLSEPTEHKKGGGCRVKKIVMSDEWGEMVEDTESTIDLSQVYGQEYSYELVDGGSSGVATYEPVGSKENPFVQPVFVNNNRLLGPGEENYMEKPFGESFFPSPAITYSRVSVKNLERFDEVDDHHVTKHATGHVVTEFYTSKDFPTITDQTYLRLEEDHSPLLAAVFTLNKMKHLTMSQGYVVHLNDMNGKMKKQMVYAEGQVDAISGVEYHYDLNTPDVPSSPMSNKGKLDNVVWAMEGNGDVKKRPIGVEQNIINDFREMKSSTQVSGVDMATQTFAIGLVVIPVPTMFPKFSRDRTKLNMATTTKVINSFGILRETVAFDAGAQVSTRNLVWDAETGEVLITETVNEYDDHYYSFNFPSHWYYEGMGQASFNSGVVLNFTADFLEAGAGNYEYTGIDNLSNYLGDGDEVLVASGDPSVDYEIAWVKNVDGGAGTFYLMDEDGDAVIVPGSGSSANLRVIRSGRRNLQSTSMGSVVMQGNPFDLFQYMGGYYNFDPSDLDVEEGVLVDDPDYWDKKRIVNAGAVEFRENWDLQCECGFDPENGSYNPYRYNMLGVWRANKSHLYLTGRIHNAGDPNPRHDGFYNTYQNFYQKEGGDWEVPGDISDTWTHTSEVTQYSPYGFELENADALERFSAAQYGYNFSFPLAVGANTAYTEMGYDGFEDYNFDGCESDEHFGFRSEESTNSDVTVTNARSHTGRFAIKVSAGKNAKRLYRINCE